MKKKLTAILILVLVLFTAGFSKTNQQKKQEEVVVKTYFLKNISPTQVANSLKPYIFNHSTFEEKKMLTVTILKRNVKAFEELIRKLDLKPKIIKLRIFTIIASHKDLGPEKIKNQDLKKVINELDKILNFKSYVLDGTSYISVKEGSRHNRLSLSSKFLHPTRRAIELDNVTITIDKEGKQVVEVELDTAFRLQTNISIVENGYVVAGVSSLHEKEDSLILILNTTIID